MKLKDYKFISDPDRPGYYIGASSYYCGGSAADMDALLERLLPLLDAENQLRLLQWADKDNVRVVDGVKITGPAS